MTVSASLRLAVKLKRQHSKMTLAELARRSEVDVGQLSRFMRGERSLHLDTVDRLARYLGWPPKIPAPEYIVVNMSPERSIVAKRGPRAPDVPSWEYESLCGRKRLRWPIAHEELNRLYGVGPARNGS
jgi:transcriptional regulator with XRE-family HTH domain